MKNKFEEMQIEYIQLDGVVDTISTSSANPWNGSYGQGGWVEDDDVILGNFK